MSMTVPNQNDLALESICRKLQLDKTRQDTLTTAYSTVTKWLEDDESFWGADDHDVLLYAYGSRAIGTVVKPKGHEEYDLDFAVQINENSAQHTPRDLRQRLFDRLHDHGTYHDKISLIRFGVRINYEGQLHMDIMPVCVVEGTNRVQAPDCKRERWAIRNLKGYSQWFESKYVRNLRKLPLYERYLSEGLITIEAKAETEALPQAVPFVAVQPLQKAVQLIKRHRNIHFEGKEESAASSIILTTLAGDYYDGSYSTVQAVDHILRQLLQKRAECKINRTKLKVYNPADSYLLQDNHRELLSSKWEEPGGDLLYDAFWKFVEGMNSEWMALQLAKSKQDKLIVLKRLFGETIGNELLEERSIWEINTDSRVTYDLPHLKRTAARTTPWLRG